MKNKPKVFILMILMMLVVSLSRDVLAEKKDNEQSSSANEGKPSSANKPTDRFQQNLEKVNKYSESAEASADKSLKKLDKIYQLLSNYYQKSSQEKPDPNIETKLELIARKQEETQEKFKEARDEIKEFKKTEKGLAGATNQLRVRTTAFVQSFNEYKSMLLELVVSMKRYSQNSAPAPSVSVSPSSSGTPEVSPKSKIDKKPE